MGRRGLSLATCPTLGHCIAWSQNQSEVYETNTGWWFSHPSEKYESQLGGLISKIWEHKKWQPNRQPGHEKLPTSAADGVINPGCWLGHPSEKKKNVTWNDYVQYVETWKWSQPPTRIRIGHPIPLFRKKDGRCSSGWFGANYDRYTFRPPRELHTLGMNVKTRTNSEVFCPLDIANPMMLNLWNVSYNIHTENQESTKK